MKDKTVLFVSTVREWGGSEVLWAETALSMLAKGYKVKFATRYSAAMVERLKSGGASYIYIGIIGTVERVLRKMKLKPHPFKKALFSQRPQLVVISEGSNIDARLYMNMCRANNVPYVTIIQLVTNILWAFIDDQTINELREGYEKARVNYFVSRANLMLHNQMLGDDHSNCKTLAHPFPTPKKVPEKYPNLVNNQYQVAVVGRIEFFHKGHDILIEVLKQEKWKERAIVFNLYGKGPHVELLQRQLKANDIRNIVLKGHVQGIEEVWKNNQLLILPSRMEGQSLALLEALWCNRAAVVTDVGGASELIIDGETGFLAPFPTVLHVDEALERAWAVRDQWEQVGKNAGKKIREVYPGNSLEEFTSEIVRVFEEVSVA